MPISQNRRQREKDKFVDDGSGNTAVRVKLVNGGDYTASNVTPSRTFDADTVTTAELADIVGTLLSDLGLT